MLVKGSIATLDEFVRRRWCAEKNRLFTRTDELAFCREWVGQFRSKLSADLDEALALVGEHFDGSDIHASGTPRSGNIKPDGNIVPPPTLLVEKRRPGGADHAVVTVWPCNTPPARHEGHIHVRWCTRSGFATAQDELILNEQRRYRDRPFDVQPVAGASPEEIDCLRFEAQPGVVAAIIAREAP